MRRHHQPIQERVDHAEFMPLNLIDEGGMGSIIEVEEAQTGRPVALKVMHPEMLKSEEALERFQLEAKVLARLEHPNIVPLHVLKNDREGRPFYTMKKVAGKSLQQILSGLRRGEPDVVAAFPLDRLINVFYKVCDAIAFAHSRRIVHRDLKPANIMVGEFGEVLVMDWGLAKLIGENGPDKDDDRPAGGPDVEMAGSTDEREVGALTISAAAGALTREGAVMGTPQYMSPEQATGRISDIDGRSDVFLLGGILHAIMTLHPPFHGKDVRAILSRVAHADFDNPLIYADRDTVAEIFPMTPADFKLAHCPAGSPPAGLAAISAKAMSVESEKRYQSVKDLQADINAWRNGYATTAEKAGLVRQLGLLVARNVVPSLAIVLVFCLAVGFGVKTRISEIRAEDALRESQQAVPMIEEEARALIGQGRFEEAIGQLDLCLALRPGRPQLLVLQGNCYQSLFKYVESITAYEAALAINPGLPGVADSVKYSVAMSKKGQADALASNERLSRFARLLERQGRRAELAVLKSRQSEVRKDVLVEIGDFRDAMRKAGAPSAISRKLRMEGGRLALDLSGVAVTNLAFLKNIPVAELDLSNTRLTSLESLAGLPLERLWLGRVSISRIEPLKGMRLRHLDLSGTRVANITVLSGMPLQKVNLSGTAATNLTALAKAPLVELGVSDCRELLEVVPAFRPTLRRLYAAGTPAVSAVVLAGLKLEELNVAGNGYGTLAAFKGMPLTNLNVANNGIRELSGLVGMPLRSLSLDGNPIADLASLQGMPLETLSLRGTAVTGVEGLAGLPLERLVISETRITSLVGLAGLPVQELELRSLAVDDLSPLAGLPLKTVDLTGCTYLTDVTALADCLELEQIALPLPPQRKLNLNKIRILPHLRRITLSFQDFGYEWRRIGGKDVEAFWKVYDANWGKVFKGK
jgi:serine/threonine protein kinase/Leucine-rich repeat (LRR) protein